MASDAILGKLVAMRTRAVWALRALWFLLPLTVGQAASDAIASADHAVPQVMTVGLWIFWAVGLVVAMVPIPLTLTIVRILAPAATPLAVWAAFDSDFSGIAIGALAHAIAVALVALNPLIGDRFVDGGSYGDERRMLLRPPAPVGFFLAPLLWAVMVAGLTAGPLLLADERWMLGAVVSLAAVGVSIIGLRALHQLARRWIVFVPSGLVLHDSMAVTEPVLFRRTSIERLGAAIVGSPARDLSNKSAGLLLECELTDAAPLGLREGAATATMTDVRRFLFCPSRPGELLDEAERRNFATDG